MPFIFSIKPRLQETSQPDIRLRRLAMREVVPDRRGGGADVEQRNHPFQLVVTGSMEHVADRHHAAGFQGKVGGESRRAAAQNAGHRIQFSAATREIGTRRTKVRRRESAHSCKKDAIFPVPEAMRIRRLRLRDDRSESHRRYGSRVFEKQ